MADFFHTPVDPFPITSKCTASELVKRMEGTSFQARNLATGVDIWARMLEGETTIFFGLAGAMVPAGMRRVMVYLIQNRLIDCLVSTGANLFHDLHETLGKRHWKGSPHMDDVELGRAKVNRIYDVVASEDEYIEMDEFITAFSNSLDSSRPYTTREYFRLLGEELSRRSSEEGILTAAAKAGVPIYSPAIADSVYGMAVAAGRAKGQNRLLFDLVQDVIETTEIAIGAKSSGVVYVGGGTPKNFIQQTEVCAYILGEKPRGHEYAVQITMDSPQWGGLSGCTFEEAQSWRKIAPQAKMVTINSDATIALPIIVSALAEREELIRNRKRPLLPLK